MPGVATGLHLKIVEELSIRHRLKVHLRISSGCLVANTGSSVSILELGRRRRQQGRWSEEEGGETASPSLPPTESRPEGGANGAYAPGKYFRPILCCKVGLSMLKKCAHRDC